MKVAVIGTGYVGLVVGACLAETGNDVICADLDEEKIASLKKGKIPIYEPGLETLVLRNVKGERLTFTTDVSAAVSSQDIIIIAVGTPPGEDGSADLRHVLDVAQTIGRNTTRRKIVVTKSTVPVGTAARVRATIESLSDAEVHVCANPEFLKEGAAVEDFMRPDRIIIGADDEWAATVLGVLYAPFVRTGNPIINMDVTSAELTKYAANAMLAARISFMNQLSELCEATGADVNMIRKGVGSDRRIGSSFLFPGPGYGGSCFPKDVRALIRTADEHGVDLGVMKAVEEANDRQKRRVLEKILQQLKDPGKARVAMWGLAFKADTDDVRESPAVVVIEGLLAKGAAVVAHDPAANDNIRMLFGDTVELVDNAYEALNGADALCVLTEWLEYRSPDFDRMKELLRAPVIVDGRNLWDPGWMRQAGFEYVSIGRNSV